jgi:hypothetical protein
MPKDISKEIMSALKKYTTEVQEELILASEETAKEAAKELRRTSPKRTGKYSKGWRAKKLKDGQWVVHNKTDYHKSHLLEHGYAKRGGGRVAAQYHIAPAEDRAIAKFTDRVRRVIKK